MDGAGRDRTQQDCFGLSWPCAAVVSVCALVVALGGCGSGAGSGASVAAGMDASGADGLPTVDALGPTDAATDASATAADAAGGDALDAGLDVAGASDTPGAATPCSAVDCDDGEPCTTDTCDTATGACIHTPHGGACSGGTCFGGACCLPVCTTPCGSDGCGGTCACADGQVCFVGGCIADPEWAQWPAPPDAPVAYDIQSETVRDLVTGLVWQRQSVGPPMNQAEAEAACAASQVQGHDDWRLPTATELISIVDWTRSGPAISPAAFPQTAPLPYWSASRHALKIDFGWAVDFDTGRLDFGPFKIEMPLRVRCVRSGGGAP